MRSSQEEIISFDSLVANLKKDKKRGEILWFRGHANIDWELQPSIARDCANPIQREWALLKRFKQNANSFLPDIQRSSWEWLLLMQHYFVPTRLLDWSESPLIGLYFAVENKKFDKFDGALWVLSPVKLNTHAGFRLTYKNDLFCFDIDGELDSYLPEQVIRNPGLLLDKPIAVIGPQSSTRMIAQHAVFTIFHSKFTPIEQVANDQCFWRYPIPKGIKPIIRENLNTLGYNQLTLFPELGNVGSHVKGFIK